MKLKKLIFAGIFIVLFCACGTEQPATEPVQSSEITQDVEKNEITSAPDVTATQEPTSTLTVTPALTQTPIPTAAPKTTVTPELTATPVPTATPKPTVTPAPTASPKQTELAEHLRSTHKDEISAELVEKGYWYEVGETYTDGIFTFDFKAVTGDLLNPLLVIDVMVADEALAAAHDELRLYAYTVGEESYDNYLEHYFPREGKGIRDETVKNLYHVTLSGSDLWMIDGEPFVVDICEVIFENASGGPTSYVVETPECRLTIPTYKFHPVLKKGDTGCVFTHKGKEYYLEAVDCGRYGTEIFFGAYADREAVQAFPEGAYQYTLSVHPDWMEFVEKLTLETNEENYRSWDNSFYIYMENDSEEGDYYGGGAVRFPGIDFAEVSDLKLWLGTEGYDLKSGSAEVLHREPPAPILEKGQAELSAHLREIHQDEVSAGLVDEGYFYLVEERRTDSGFCFDLIALTGDFNDRKMVFDVTVDDEELTEKYDTIYLNVGAYSETRYNANERSWNSEGYGIRDKENKNLYHVTMDNGGPNFGPVVINICRVGFGTDPEDMSGSVWFGVEQGKFEFDVPNETYAPVLNGDYENLVFSYGERKYGLNYICFGNYRSEAGFYTMIDSEEVPEEEEAQKKYMEERQKEWLEFEDTLILTVDGKEYKVMEKEEYRRDIWFYEEEEESAYRGIVFPNFPVIDYRNVSKIELKSGDTVYRLK